MGTSTIMQRFGSVVKGKLRGEFGQPFTEPPHHRAQNALDKCMEIVYTERMQKELPDVRFGRDREGRLCVRHKFAKTKCCGICPTVSLVGSTKRKQVESSFARSGSRGRAG